MDDLDGSFVRLKEQILMERRNKTGRFCYSPELKLAVIDLVTKAENGTNCASRLGLSHGLIYNWKILNKVSIPPPRRLIVAPDNEKMASLHSEKTSVQTFDAVFANGIIIKGLPLTAESLQLIGGVK